VRGVDDRLRHRGVHRQDADRATDNGAGEQLHTIRTAGELRSGAPARFVGGRDFGARPPLSA
jgi:hypothetical protein